MADLKKLQGSALGLLSLLIAGALLIVDLMLPEFDATSVLYMVPMIFATVFTRHQKILLGAICTMFVITGYIWHHSFTLELENIIPRSTAILGIWTIALVAMSKIKLMDQMERRETRINSLIEERTQQIHFQANRKVDAIKTEFQKNKNEVVKLRNTAKKIDQARQQAEYAVKARMDLFSSLGRQFCSSLEGIKGLASILNDTRLDSEQHNYVATILSSSKALHSLAKDLEDLPQIENGSIELEESVFVLQSVLEEALDLAGIELNEFRVGLTASLDPDLPTTFLSDANRIRQLLTYIIGIAARFSPESSASLTLESLERSDAICRFHGRIQSSKTILTKDGLDAVSKILSQDISSLIGLASGRDLPLFLSAKLCRAFNGNIWIEERNERGLCIQFTLEIRIASAQQPALSIKPWFKGKNILVVDNSKATRNWLTFMLKSWGIRSTAVKSGPEALQWFAAGNLCDALILDLNLPDIDGLTLARQIRRQNPHLPVLLMTAYGERIVDAGISASISKPLKLTALHYKLSALMNDNSEKQGAGWFSDLISAEPVQEEIDEAPEPVRSHAVAGEAPVQKRIEAPDSDASVALQDAPPQKIVSGNSIEEGQKTPTLEFFQNRFDDENGLDSKEDSIDDLPIPGISQHEAPENPHVVNSQTETENSPPLSQSFDEPQEKIPEQLLQTEDTSLQFFHDQVLELINDEKQGTSTQEPVNQAKELANNENQGFELFQNTQAETDSEMTQDIVENPISEQQQEESEKTEARPSSWLYALTNFMDEDEE